MKYLLLCFTEKKKLRFKTTWGWVNSVQIFIFGWTNPYTSFKSDSYSKTKQIREKMLCIYGCLQTFCDRNTLTSMLLQANFHREHTQYIWGSKVTYLHLIWPHLLIITILNLCDMCISLQHCLIFFYCQHQYIMKIRCVCIAQPCL